MYVVENFLSNGSIVLQNLDINELEKKSMPRDQLKKIQTQGELISNTQDSMTDNRGDIAIQDSDTEMDTINNTIHNMKKMEDSNKEMDTNDNTI